MSKKPRVSAEQRQFMLQFMMGHEDLAKGRVSGADASRRRGVMLQELASALNAMGNGATKSPEKWWKCWQDWRCDTKAKAQRHKLHRQGTGGGPGPAPLSQLEETLLQFCGIEILVQGLEEVGDPLELVESVQNTDEETFTVLLELPQEGAPPEKQKKNKNHNDENLHNILERQAAALERLPDAINNLAEALKTGLQALASRTPPPN